MSLTLIADSGIQFHKVKLIVKTNERVIKPVGFLESVNKETFNVNLEFAHYLTDQDVWVSVNDLKYQGYIDESGSLIEENVNLKEIRALNEETECYVISSIIRSLEKLENVWIPLPFFETQSSGNTDFGPLNWARIKLIPTSNDKRIKEYDAVLAFDTKTAKEENDYDSPLLNSNREFGSYELCDDGDQLLNFCSEDSGGQWIDEYLAQIMIGGKENISGDFPSLEYISNYIYFVKYLKGLNILPDVKLFTNRSDRSIDVDLVLDIGNSRTCGILFESAPTRNSFEFNEVAKLSIRDLSRPNITYTDPFSMRLAFHLADFGEIGIDENTFRWPSFIRIGKEAQRLIYQARPSDSNGQDRISHHSSPKRYLWDDEPSRVQWELIRLPDDQFVRDIYIPGISEQFDKEGNLVTGDTGIGIHNNYSRKSLMAFVFMEILSHAMVQINSPEFRTKHGEISQSRRLRRVVITCPTAMVKEEQIALRACAESAATALDNFYNRTHGEPNAESSGGRRNIEIIPAVKDLKRSLQRLDTVKDWIYDEATCSQLVFLYAEISKRYLNNCTKYFNLYGKVREDLPGYNDKSITIGSVDIGGGTTDLMISAYQYSDAGTAVLTPVPLYWESFNYAGDDLLKQMVQQIVLEGDLEDEAQRGAKGVIANALRDRGLDDVERKLNDFFGTDNARLDYKARQMRKKFNVQISVPIAERYLEHARAGKDNIYATFDDLFPTNRPSKDVLDYFEAKFGFRFEEIKWKLSTGRVEEIVQTVFEPLIRQLSTLLFAKGCDFVLLAGRPTSLQMLSEMFLKYYPVAPDRLITLNDYRVGRWYPFHDGDGYFQDHKSIVAVGAFVALMGGKLDRLSSFRLNMEELKYNLISTAEYFGVYDPNTEKISNIFIDPDTNINKIKVSGLPISIGFKQLNADAYPGRLIYLLDFNDEKIIEKVKLQSDVSSEDDLMERVEVYKTNLKNKMPFLFQVERDYQEDRELLKLDSVEDKEQNSVPKNIFDFRLQTLEEDKGYWLDTGEFHLKINAR